MKSIPLERDWDGETVVCIGSGPSLSRQDVEYIKGKARIIAINDNYRLADYADILYSCDFKWWNWHEGVPEFQGVRMSQDAKACEKYGLQYIEGRAGSVLSTDQSYINHGSNSGFQAINIAYLKGAARIVLIGYDMQPGDERSHWFGDHPDKIRSHYLPWIEIFKRVAAQNLVEIINCTKQTALDAFPCAPLREIL